MDVFIKYSDVFNPGEHLRIYVNFNLQNVAIGMS